MAYIALAIFASGIIPVLFRGCDGWRVNLFWAIPINYLTCVAIGTLLLGNSFAAGDVARQPWIGLAAIQGILLAVNFFLLAALWLVLQGVGQLVLATGSRSGIDAGRVMEQLRQHSPMARLLLASFFGLWLYSVVDAALARCNGNGETR